MLEEGVSDHRYERVAMKALTGSSLEVVEAIRISNFGVHNHVRDEGVAGSNPATPTS